MQYFKLEIDELLVAWLSDKIADCLKDENLAERVLQEAEQKIKHRRQICFVMPATQRIIESGALLSELYGEKKDD